MKKKVESGKLKPGRDETMATAATEIKTGETKDSRGREGFRQRFLENLILKKEETEKAINRLTSGRKEHKGLFSPDESIELMDRAELEVAAQIHYDLLGKKSKELKKIKILIHRVQHEKEFGLCEECGRRIPEERLLIVPEATRCVPCQKEIERLESGKSLLISFNLLSQVKKGLQWEDNEDSDEEEGFVVKPDTEGMSIFDLEEIDLEDYPVDENNKGFPPRP